MDNKIDFSLEANGYIKVYPPLKDIEITPNKETQVFKNDEEYGYDHVTVNPIPEEYIDPKGYITINENGVKNVREYNNVVVDVKPEIPNGYLKPTGTKTITENGTHDVTNVKEANVNVEPNLQDLSIMILEKGTITLKADEGYDGLNTVEINTSFNVGEGSSGGIELPEVVTKDTLADYVGQVTPIILNPLLETTNTNEGYINDNVIIYTPMDTYKYYCIRKNSGYNIIWCNHPILNYDSYNTMSINCLQIGTYEISNGESKPSSVKPYNKTGTYYISGNYNTLDECIQALQNKNTIYTSGSTAGIYTNTLITETMLTPCSNMICFGKNGILTPSRKVSNNETIEVIG